MRFGANMVRYGLLFHLSDDQEPSFSFFPPDVLRLGWPTLCDPSCRARFRRQKENYELATYARCIDRWSILE